MVRGARSSHAPIVQEIVAALDRIGVGPDLQAERTLHEVHGGPALALALDHRQLPFVVAQRLGASFGVERQAQVIHRVRVARDVLGIPRRPRPGQLGLREDRSGQRRPEQQERDKRRSTIITTWPSTVWDPIWNRPLPS